MLIRIDRWLGAHLSYLALIPIAIFVLFAFRHASLSYLHPDEAQQYLRADTDSLANALRASLTQSHPPLYILGLHLTTGISRDPLFLRATSFLAAAGALWLTFVWARRAFDDRIAAATLIVMAGSPGLLAIAPQIRPYALTLLLIAAALYGLERMVRGSSIGWTVFYSLALGGMVGSYYGAAWIAVALAIYVPLRFRRERSPAPVVRAWALCQAVGIAGGLWLLIPHLVKLRGDIDWAAKGFLRGSFYLGHGSRWEWARQAGEQLFQFFAHGHPMKEHGWSGTLLILLFLGGLLLLTRDRRRRDLALLLSLPLALAAAGGAAELLPFGGTRHTSYLLPFVSAGAAVALATLLPRLSLLAGVALVTVPLRLGHASPAISPQAQPPANLDQTLRLIRTEIPAGEPIVVDRQAYYLLRFYLAPNGSLQSPRRLPKAGDHELLRPPGRQIWTLHASSLLRAVAMIAGQQLEEMPAEVWVVSHSLTPRPPLSTVLPPGSRWEKFGGFEIVKMPFPHPP